MRLRITLLVALLLACGCAPVLAEGADKNADVAHMRAMKRTAEAVWVPSQSRELLRVARRPLREVEAIAATVPNPGVRARLIYEACMAHRRTDLVRAASLAMLDDCLYLRYEAYATLTKAHPDVVDLDVALRAFRRPLVPVPGLYGEGDEWLFTALEEHARVEGLELVLSRLVHHNPKRLTSHYPAIFNEEVEAAGVATSTDWVYGDNLDDDTVQLLEAGLRRMIRFDQRDVIPTLQSVRSRSLAAAFVTLRATLQVYASLRKESPNHAASRKLASQLGHFIESCDDLLETSSDNLHTGHGSTLEVERLKTAALAVSVMLGENEPWAARVSKWITETQHQENTCALVATWLGLHRAYNLGVSYLNAHVTDVRLRSLVLRVLILQMAVRDKPRAMQEARKIPDPMIRDLVISAIPVIR